MSDRYFITAPISGNRVTLGGAEAHHLADVMRVRPGSRVTLFDGSGDEFTAEVERVGRDRVELTILGREQVDRELPLDLTLAVALPKGQRQKWLVEKAVELGVTRLVPLVTARSVAQPGDPALGRLRRIVIEASKQCGRNRLLAIGRPQRWGDFLAAADSTACRLLAHRSREAENVHSSHTGNPLARADLPERVVAAIGPEGGFSPDEAHAAISAGWQPINLGPRVLRIETAAVLIVAMIVARG